MKYRTDFCNREYNNRALVPEHGQILARWARTAAEVRQRHTVLHNLSYGGTPRQCLDLFPAPREAAPLLVFIHGGYWRSLDKSDFSWVAPPFVERGVSVAVIGYDLAPAVSLETITLQVLRAIEWLYRNAERNGYDGSRIVVAGHSAGGHLTAMTMAAMWPLWDPDLPADLVKGGVAISGLYDLEPMVHASFLNADLKLDARSALRLSPAWMPPATRAPLVTAVGGLESSEFRRQNALIAQRWPKNFHRDVTVPGCNHFTVLDRLADPASPLFRAALGLCSR